MKGPGLSQNKIDVDSVKTHRRGVGGWVEWTFRRFRTVSHLLLIGPLYALGAVVLGFAMTPGALFWQWVHQETAQWASVPRTLALTSSGAGAFFCFGFTLLLVLPLMNFLMRTRLKPWRGPYYSLPSVPWYIHNGLTYIARYTFLEFCTPTPFNVMFYKLMGMKIGRGTVINSTCISDPSLISLGEKTTIGGSVTIVGHYGQGGFLVLAPVHIGHRVTVGLKASIMGGVSIGDNAKILPHSVVMPKTVIPAGETWGGVPARSLTEADLSIFKKAA